MLRECEFAVCIYLLVFCSVHALGQSHTCYHHVDSKDVRKPVWIATPPIIKSTCVHCFIFTATVWSTSGRWPSSSKEDGQPTTSNSNSLWQHCGCVSTTLPFKHSECKLSIPTECTMYMCQLYSTVNCVTQLFDAVLLASLAECKAGLSARWITMYKLHWWPTISYNI